MAARITKKKLESLISDLNTAVGAPQTIFAQTEERRIIKKCYLTPGIKSGLMRAYDKDGKSFDANVGNFFLSEVTDKHWGGFNLCQMVNKEGGFRNVFESRHIPARDLYDRIEAFLQGINYAKELKKI